jgi:glutamate--cysteine ligase
MVKKLRVGLALQPVATALFANSPFKEGKPNGYLSYRSHIWTDTDPDRTGLLPWAFEDGMGFERYADYALDVPMYFVYRKGTYHNVAGQSFRDFLEGKLPGLPGELPTMKDWEDHVTTLFPEVRVKKYIEMRGADGGPWRRLCALPALWVGLLYDGGALDAAWDLVKDWSEEDRAALHAAVPRQGLHAPLTDNMAGGTMLELARRVLEIAAEGLRARNRSDSFGENETHFLNALHTIVESGRTPAEDLLELYHGKWQGSVDPVFSEFAY